MKSKKITIGVIILLALGLGAYGFLLYQDIFSGNTKFGDKELYVNIPTNSTFEDVKKILSPIVDDINRFEKVADKKSYPENVKAG